MKKETTAITGTNTSDINLVSSLNAMGIGGETGAVNHNGETTRVYIMDTVSSDGKIKTKDLISAWKEGEEWIKRNNTHPYAYIMRVLMCRKKLLDGIKQDLPLERISSGDSHAFLSPNCSPESEAKLLSEMGQ